MSLLLSKIDQDQNIESRNASVVSESLLQESIEKKNKQLTEDLENQVKQLKGTVKQLSDSKANLKAKI